MGLAFKESGFVGLVDYTLPGFPLVKNIATERFLHDGGWDHTGRYFLVAANASNKMVAVDMQTQTMAASFTTGGTPHPGRGANWFDPVYGWVNATPHIGEPKVRSTAPTRWPSGCRLDSGAGNHPALGRIAVPQDPSELALGAVRHDPEHDSNKQMCAYNKETATLDRCFPVATNGKATHFEFNQAGTEVWVSDWANDGAVIVSTAPPSTRSTGSQTW